MNRDNLIKIKAYIEKCLEYKTKKLELDKFNKDTPTKDDLEKRDFGLDLTEIWIFVHHALNPDMYEINKEVLNKEIIKRRFQK